MIIRGENSLSNDILKEDDRNKKFNFIELIFYEIV